MARALAVPIPLSELVERFGGGLEAADPGLPIRRLASLAPAQPGDLSFFGVPRHREAARSTRASAVIVTTALAGELPAGTARILVDDPYAHFAAIARLFDARLAPQPVPGIHPSALIDPSATISADASIGPHCVVGPGAVVAAGAALGPGCHLGRDAHVGEATVLHAGVVVYHDCRIGARGIVHAGTVIGSDGFGFARVDRRWEKIPQLGAVLIGDDVEIGSNCSIDRGALEDTVIGDGCKLDNLIQIAHNVVIGEHSALAACVGVAGSARIGRRCMIGGGSGIVGHIEICDDAVIGAMSMVTRSIRKPGFYTGAFPLMDNADWERAAATVKQLPALRARLRRLEAGVTAPAPDDERDTDA